MSLDTSCAIPKQSENEQEKAEAALRVENMKNYVKQHNLSSAAALSATNSTSSNSRNRLPDTMSPKAHAALDKSFSTKASRYGVNLQVATANKRSKADASARGPHESSLSPNNDNERSLPSLLHSLPPSLPFLISCTEM